MERLGLIVVGVLLAAVVGVIAVESTGSDSASGPVSEAMRLVPADADVMWFADLAHQRERLGFGDLTTRSSEAEISEFMSTAGEEPWVGSSLFDYAIPMREWGWSFVDVEWEVSYSAEDYAIAYKLRDDLDMGVVESSLEEQGYERSEVDGYPAFDVRPDDAPEGEGSIPVLHNIVVMPEEHLVLAGPNAQVLLATAIGDAESMADSDRAAGLAASVEEPEFLALGTRCIDPRDMLGKEPPPEALERFESTLRDIPGYTDLQPSVAHVGAIESVSGVPIAAVAVAYADSETAAADVEPRQALLDLARSPLYGKQYAELLAAQAVSDGSLVRYEFGTDDIQAVLAQMLRNNDLPWAYCPLDQ